LDAFFSIAILEAGHILATAQYSTEEEAISPILHKLPQFFQALLSGVTQTLSL